MLKKIYKVSSITFEIFCPKISAKYELYKKLYSSLQGAHILFKVFLEKLCQITGFCLLEQFQFQSLSCRKYHYLH